MGIVNVTPDSFSDGGRFLAVDDAVEHVARLVAEGADIVDIGGESTRPGAEPVSVDDELSRILPVVERVVGLGVPISVDTRHAAVAEAAIDVGAVMINDISGLRDRAMRAVAVCHQVPVVVMHMPIDDPATMQLHTDYVDVVGDVCSFLVEQTERALADGVPQVVVDPGIGFGKTTAQSLELDPASRRDRRSSAIQCSSPPRARVSSVSSRPSTTRPTDSPAHSPCTSPRSLAGRACCGCTTSRPTARRSTCGSRSSHHWSRRNVPALHPHHDLIMWLGAGR